MSLRNGRNLKNGISSSSKAAEAVDEILQMARTQTVTFVYAAKDGEHNNAAALKDYLEKHK
jgi:uncharacterized protein YeaO (DUF488 family)